MTTLRPASRDLDELFGALQKSSFRRRFVLGTKERAYLSAKGLPTVLEHASDFVARRLAPALPVHDGKQTPMRGHPVFIAQHATATCCRGCLAKWHGIAAGRPLSAEEQARAVSAIAHWLETQFCESDGCSSGAETADDPNLFSLSIAPTSAADPGAAAAGLDQK